MDLLEIFHSYGPWAWIVGGFILLALELVLPGGILVWMGAAGILTGLVAFFQPLAWPVQWAIFGVVSLVSIFLWLRFARHRPVRTDKPLLNQRAEQYVGQHGVLSEPIANGFGRMVLGDGVWRVTGPDLNAGERVLIIGHDGAVLRVDRAG